MVSFSDLTDPEAVNAALAEFDAIGRFGFLEKHGFGPAREYFVVTEFGRYDSKAIFAVAYEYQHGEAVSADEFTGGKAGAAKRLLELGFTIEGLDDDRGRKTFATFEDALSHFKIPFENLPIVREFVAQRDYSEAYIPRSSSYIAMVPAGGGPVHYINRGSIYYRKEDGEGELITLPVNRMGGNGFNRRNTQSKPAELCPECWLELPLNGECLNH
jgi:hypothetical protein